jgi:hypothetical protein
MFDNFTYLLPWNNIVKCGVWILEASLFTRRTHERSLACEKRKEEKNSKRESCRRKSEQAKLRRAAHVINHTFLSALNVLF